MMENPTKNTMFNYFNKLLSKTPVVEENPRKVAPLFNEQHVKEFQGRVEAFDTELLDVKETSNYINSIRSGDHKPFKIDKRCKGPMRARLLQFCEDVRPPYFGTWQKTSKLVTGRRIHARDEDAFDYDNDSEAEWDLGGPGESLKGDDSEDEEEQDDYEIDMKTFVPHGYVSDDENDSDSDVKIIHDTAAKKRPEQLKQQQQQPQHQQHQQQQQHAPIILGINYEDSPTISATKMQFLKTFEGVCI